MTNIIPLSVDDALEDGFVAPTQIEDPVDYLAFDQKLVTAEYIGAPLFNELQALINGRVSSKSYRRVFTCLAGLNAGDPVRISGNNAVVLALATTLANSKVFAFCRKKLTSTTCLIEHFVYKSGLTGLTAGGDVYLTNAGGFSATAGTIAKRVGIAISTTEALLFADALGDSSGGEEWTAKTGDYPLTVDDSGGNFTNAGAGATITFTLPAVKAGLRYRIYRTAAQTVIISGGTIYYGDSTGTTWTQNSLGMVELVCDGTNWIATHQTGDKDLA